MPPEHLYTLERILTRESKPRSPLTISVVLYKLLKTAQFSQLFREKILLEDSLEDSVKINHGTFLELNTMIRL